MCAEAIANLKQSLPSGDQPQSQVQKGRVLRSVTSFVRCRVESVMAIRRLATATLSAVALAKAEDSFVFLDNGVIRVGVDATRGGSIGYLAQSGTNYSVINTHDMGREIQLSFYAGPNPCECGVDTGATVHCDIVHPPANLSASDNPDNKCNVSLILPFVSQHDHVLDLYFADNLGNVAVESHVRQG